jgi:cytochrome c oxidase subunit 5a
MMSGGREKHVVTPVNPNIAHVHGPLTDTQSHAVWFCVNLIILTVIMAVLYLQQLAALWSLMRTGSALEKNRRSMVVRANDVRESRSKAYVIKWIAHPGNFRFIPISTSSKHTKKMRPQALSTVLRSTLRPAITSSSSSSHTLSRARLPCNAANPVGTTSTTFTRSSSSSHDQESFESFSARYVAFFQSAEDLFEVQRGLNNCFAHDLVPSPAVVEAALRAARRVNDYSTAVRVFEGIREKVENKQQYLAYLEELKGVREELGVYFFLPFYFCALRLMGYVRRSGHKGRTFHFMKPFRLVGL